MAPVDLSGLAVDFVGNYRCDPGVSSLEFDAGLSEKAVAMSLYLVIFDEDEEVDGFQLGSYSDFGTLRKAVAKHIEGGIEGSKYPTLMLHSDCDGEWTPSQSACLEKELEDISAAFRKLPPVALTSEWQKQIAEEFNFQMTSLYDCFFDVNGEPLLERLTDLARLSQAKKLPVLFQ